MAGMVRRQIYLRPEQDEALKRRARELGISESELIRRSIDQVQPAVPGAEREAAKQRLEALWKERAALPSNGEGRTWTREELYDRPKHWHSG